MHGAKQFPCFISVNLYNNPKQEALLIAPFYKWMSRVPKKLNWSMRQCEEDSHPPLWVARLCISPGISLTQRWHVTFSLLEKEQPCISRIWLSVLVRKKSRTSQTLPTTQWVAAKDSSKPSFDVVLLESDNLGLKTWALPVPSWEIWDQLFISYETQLCGL